MEEHRGGGAVAVLEPRFVTPASGVRVTVFVYVFADVATTTTVTTPAAPPLHHQPGLPKIAATPGFVDPAKPPPPRGPCLFYTSDPAHHTTSVSLRGLPIH